MGSETVPEGPDGGRAVTLAFGLAAFEALADPRAAFADARRWSRHVGVVGDDAGAVEAAVREYGVRQDYEVGTLDAQSVLSRLKWETDTDRYVLVGTGETDRELAEYVNWEYVSVADAAAAADWQLAADLGPLGRVRLRLARLAPWRR